jgi:mannan endo-1,4-beta-mannosidase
MKHFFCAALVILLFSNGLQATDLNSFRKTLVDKNATAETVALFYNLQKLASEGKTLIGQQDPNRTATGRQESTDIKWITGKELGVWGHDFMDISKGTLPDAPNRDEVRRAAERQTTRSLDYTIKAYDEGIVNVFCWHMRAPEPLSFYARELTDEQKNNMFRSLLPGGVHHEWYKKRLQTVADFAGKAKGKNGTLSPIIFRPFHEFDGDWFWWGKPYCTPQEYIDCWRFTVEYLRDDLGVRNFLYAFSPDNRFQSEAEYLERYPGNDYVDIVSFDNYSDFENNRIDAAAKKLKIISDYAVKHGKAAALTEVGYRRTPIPSDLYTGYYGKALADPSLQIAFFMFWRQGSTPYVPTPDSPMRENFMEFINSPRMVLLPDVGSLYAFPAPAAP